MLLDCEKYDFLVLILMVTYLVNHIFNMSLSQRLRLLVKGIFHNLGNQKLLFLVLIILLLPYDKVTSFSFKH